MKSSVLSVSKKKKKESVKFQYLIHLSDTNQLNSKMNVSCSVIVQHENYLVL